MSHLKLFGLTFLCTIIVSLGYFYMVRRNEDSLQPKLIKITDQVFLTSQLKPGSMPFLRRQHINMVIDMRPDGEAEDQPSSEQMGASAKTVGMKFHYIPVPHDSIPDKAVEALRVLLKKETAMVLYCRTGRRAVRLYALAEASQAGGPNADEILGRVKTAGFDAADLSSEIARRIAERNKSPQGAKP